jgi:hypothetical protein
MGSNAKKRTTMAKLQRENQLREKRMEKQAKKDARKRAAADERIDTTRPRSVPPS